MRVHNAVRERPSAKLRATVYAWDSHAEQIRPERRTT